MSRARSDTRVSSFPPQVAPGCRVLLLGSVPSVRSLALRQSYGHPHNLFWPLMGELFGAGPELAYAQRIARLHASGFGIWDVLKHCERPGSLDSDIVAASEVPNDIGRLLRKYPTIRVLVFNGGKAYQAFRRHIAPKLGAETLARLELVALPSTSPANASMSRATKRDRWRELLTRVPKTA